MSGIGIASRLSFFCWILVFLMSSMPVFAQDEDVLKIGLIADTQATTPEQTGYYLFRTLKADAVAKVAVRTAAQEHLALLHLELLLYDLMLTKPDVVLYLGDGANSGCKDELDNFFEVLKKTRAYWNIPIFFVIGNHDYLATGNQTGRKQRELACGSGGRGYDTKQEIVLRTAEFNRASWQSFAKEKGLFTSYDDSLDAMKADESGCNVVEEDQDSHGCFYSAVFSYVRGDHSGTFVLLDTSDYRDLKRLPERRWFGPVANLRGLHGGVSYQAGGQNKWIDTHLPSDIRSGQLFVASHYPSTALSDYSDRLGDLLVGTRNIWLSGHTHESNPATGIRSRSFVNGHYKEINVGSTTDHRAHAAIVKVVNDVAEKQPVRAMSDSDESVCRIWISGLRLTDEYHAPLTEKDDARIRLGLTRDYKHSRYKGSTAKLNINRLLQRAGADRETRIRCLMFLAAEAEKR